MSWMEHFLEVVADETGADLSDMTRRIMDGEYIIPPDIEQRATELVRQERILAENRGADDAT